MTMENILNDYVQALRIVDECTNKAGTVTGYTIFLAKLW